MVAEQVRCDKCGGLIVRDGDELKCFSCNKPVRSRLETTQFIETNKDEILADAQEVGVKQTAQKWGLSEAAVYTLVNEHGVTPARPGIRRGKRPRLPTPAAVATADPPAKGTDGVVTFPPFNEKWDPLVQIKWLEVYPQVFPSRQGGGAK